MDPSKPRRSRLPEPRSQRLPRLRGQGCARTTRWSDAPPPCLLRIPPSATCGNSRASLASTLELGRGSAELYGGRAAYHFHAYCIHDGVQLCWIEQVAAGGETELTSLCIQGDRSATRAATGDNSAPL